MKIRSVGMGIKSTSTPVRHIAAGAKSLVSGGDFPGSNDLQWDPLPRGECGLTLRSARYRPTDLDADLRREGVVLHCLGRNQRNGILVSGLRQRGGGKVVEQPRSKAGDVNPRPEGGGQRSALCLLTSDIIIWLTTLIFPRPSITHRRALSPAIQRTQGVD